MTEQLLDVPDVGAALQQVRRAGVAQVVRRERVRDVGTLGFAAKALSDNTLVN